MSDSVFGGTSDAEKAPTANSIMESATLRMEARLAAEQGDFLKATEALGSAAELVGDRITAGKARDAHAGLQAQGGSQFADFTALITLIQDQTSPPARWFEVDGEGGRMSQFSQGVFMGAPAVMAALTLAGDDSRLISAFEMAKSANTNHDVRATSNLRLVSLPRLEQHVLKLKEAGQPISDDVACLAGLTEVRFLFVFADSGDVVIGGPAGDWANDETGRTVGIAQHRPTLKFDDLVTLSRTFSSGGSGFFMCSIDPKPDQVKAVKELVGSYGPLSAKNLGAFTKKAEDTLGLQNVIVNGIPEDSRVASVIVDADYQMRVAAAESSLSESDNETLREKLAESKAKYEALKAKYAAELEAEKAPAVKTPNQLVRDRFFGEGKVGEDMNFAWVNKDNILQVYQDFYDSYKANKGDFSREDFDEVKLLYEALDSRKNTVEKEGLSSEDNNKIASIKFKFAPEFKINRIGAKARENAEAKE